MKCRRQGNFGLEAHICFVKSCGNIFHPGKTETCEKCNWKMCENGHCACDVSLETRQILDKFYDLFCEPHDYSPETRHALFIMFNTYNQFCKGCLL